MGYRLKYEAMLEVEAAVRRTGNPDLNLGKLSDALGRVERLKIRVLKSFVFLGTTAEPGTKLTIDADLARGLCATGRAEILDK
jgi:hypothetical protein